MNDYIVWFVENGIEQYDIVAASSTRDAMAMFGDVGITECHMIDEDCDPAEAWA